MALIFALFINSIIFSIILDANQFVLVFFSIFFAAAVVTFNTKALGGQISFFQSVGILGYCIFPLFICSLAVQVIRFLQFFDRWARLGLIAGSTFYCILCNFFSKFQASRAFIAVNVS